jgi:hypothetical protein
MWNKKKARIIVLMQGFTLEGSHAAVYFAFDVPPGTASLALRVQRLYSSVPTAINFHASRNILLGTTGVDEATGMPPFQNVQPLLTKDLQSGYSHLADTEVTSPVVRSSDNKRLPHIACMYPSHVQ